jgi:hypothetical protein
MPPLRNVNRSKGRRGRGGGSGKSQSSGFDASIVKQLGIWLSVSLLMAFIPVIGIVGLIGFFVLLVAVPIFFLRWWIKYFRIQTNDPDFKSAKR